MKKRLTEVRTMLREMYLKGEIDRADWIRYDNYCLLLLEVEK